MSVNNLVKRLQNEMRGDAGINGDAQRIEQMVWMFFLKVYDAQEEIWECTKDKYKSIIPEKMRWRNWAVDEKDGFTPDNRYYQIGFIPTAPFSALAHLTLKF